MKLNEVSSGSVVNMAGTASDVASTNVANGGNIAMESSSVENFEETTISTSPTQPVQQTSGSVRVKLPKLEVKKFKGSVFEWQEFWDAVLRFSHECRVVRRR
jgi:hypothetical protein